MARTKRRHPLRKLILFALFVVFCVGFFRWSQVNLTTETVSVTDDRLPASLALTIAVVSDVHGAEFGDGNADLLAAVAAQHPDLIAITGDLVDEDSNLSMLAPLARGLTAIAPTYYVGGNHEWSAGIIREVWAVLTDCGVTVLSNQYELLDCGAQTVVLAGLEDANGYADQKTLSQLTDEIHAAQGEQAYILLLTHRNTKYQEYAACGIDLVLCGHGHGGLIRLPLTDGLVGNGDKQWFPSYTAGLYPVGGGQMVVSRGLGNNPGTFRLFNRPQLLTVQLRGTA